MTPKASGDPNIAEYEQRYSSFWFLQPEMSDFADKHGENPIEIRGEKSGLLRCG
jgi:hypothetical protein